jgi:hypothetical protein
MANSANNGTLLFVAIGIALAGWFMGQGFQKGRASDRYVTVKGVAERQVKSDVVFWPLRFVSTHDDLSTAQARIKESEEEVLSFLARHDIDPDATEVLGLEVTDLMANQYRSGPAESRYIINQTLMVRTNDIARVRQASQDIGELVDAGVVLSSMGGMGGGPTYRFTRLNDLKPEMIAEATAEARRAAEQFARDSDSQLGGIRRANQGVFVIRARDQAPGMDEGGQPDKTVRVVSTIEYYLKD